MSVWNDASAPILLGGSTGQGGQGGQANGGTGGVPISTSGAGGSTVNTTVAVEGGTRDLATTQCLTLSGSSCPAVANYLVCVESNCGASIVSCYYSDGISKAGGGLCRDYANCVLACPCTSARAKCENACMQNFALPNADCSTCLYNLYNCSNTYGCVAPTTCTSPTGGSSGGSS